jgi:threonine/homoserine/homoserine lactone efflux protein
VPDTQSLLLFMAASLALNVTPGPDMLYILARSTGEGTRAGVVSAFGVATGALVHLAAITLGLATLLETVPLAYEIVRYAGAAYLLYLGARTILSRPRDDGPSAVEPGRLGRIFRQGVVTNVLNPKVALFFAAFLPQFADPARGAVIPQLIVLGLLFNLSGTLVNLGVAYAGGRAGNRVRRHLRSSRVWQRITGAIFIALGLRLALQRHP